MRTFPLLALLAAASSLAACGGGSIAIFGTVGNRRNDTNSASTVSDLAVVAGRSSPVLLRFVARDVEGDPVDVRLRYRDAGDPLDPADDRFVDLLLVAGTVTLDETPPRDVDVEVGLNGLASSAAGREHYKLWDLDAQLGPGYHEAVELEVRMQIARGGVSPASGVFDVGNDAPVVADVELPGAPGEPATGNVPIDFTLSDSSDDVVAVRVEYDRLDDALGEVWEVAHPAGTGDSGDDPFAGIVAPREGKALTFFWDTVRDLGTTEAQVRMRFQADDGVATSAFAESGTLAVDNNRAPVAFLDGAALVADPDRRGSVPVLFEVEDEESDQVDVVVQWTTSGRPFPELPETRDELRIALADPVARRVLQVAEEAPVEWRGRVRAPAGAGAIRLDAGPGALATFLARGGMAGREIELLARDDVFEPASARWPLFAPGALAAVAAFDGGRRAALLRADAATGFAIDELDLASGAVLRTLAAGLPGASGIPDAFALARDERVAWVATHVGADLLIERADLIAGTTTIAFGPSASAPAAAPARALLEVAPGRVLLTAQDALLSFHPANGALELLAGGLAEPWGLARDPARPRGVLVAERTFAGATVGRLLRFDLATLARERVGVAAGALERPRDLAWDAASGRLLATTDAGNDGLFELQSLALGGIDSGIARIVAGGLASPPVSLATGDAGLRICVLPATGDLALVGGVQQRRAIAAFDPGAQDAVPDAPFDPPPAAGASWRIVERASPHRATPERSVGQLCWDTTRIASGGAFALRIVPYDGERGIGQELTTPRSVDSGLDVVANEFSDAATTDGPAALAAGDLDADGDLDFAVACRDGNVLRLFRQVAPASFAADALALGGPASTAQPAALALADFDGDGRTDVASANRGSDSVTLFLQQANGTFPALPSRTVAAGVSAPAALVAADLDRDGRLDLVVANSGSDEVTLHLQLPGVLFGAPLVLGGPGITLDPVALVVADLDGDGRDDVAVANETGDDVALFLQAADGTFPALPDRVLAGALDRPLALVALDADADGDADLAATSYEANELVLFRQVGPLDFAPERHGKLYTLAAPTALVAGDLDRDGDDDLATLSEPFDRLALFVQSAGGTFGTGGDRDPDRSIDLPGTGALAAALALADFDGDGALDVLAAETAIDRLACFATGRRARFAAQADAALLPAQNFGNPGATVVADFDGDGLRDVAAIVIGDDVFHFVDVFMQSSPGVLPEAPTYVLGGADATPRLSALAAADLDGDGDLDLAVAAKAADVGDDSLVALFFNVSDAGAPFPSAPDATLSLGFANVPPEALVAADLDADGAVDLAVADDLNHRVAIFHQSGGVFPPAPTQLLAGLSAPSALAAGDFDGDGLVDLAVVNNKALLGQLEQGSVMLFFGGAGGLPAAPDVTLKDLAALKRPDGLVAADLDGDGRADLAVASRSTSSLVLWMQARAPAPPRSFLAPQTLGAGILDKPRAVAAGDADRDGDLDLLCVNNGGANRSLAIFLQRARGVFAAVPDRTMLDQLVAPNLPFSAAFADLDGDGELDVIGGFADPGGELAIFFGGGR